MPANVGEMFYTGDVPWHGAGAQPAQSGNALAPAVDNGHARTKVRHIAVNRQSRSQFADVAHRALAGRHEQPARTVQVIPLRLVLAVGIEHLHAMAASKKEPGEHLPAGLSWREEHPTIRQQQVSYNSQRGAGDNGSQPGASGCRQQLASSSVPSEMAFSEERSPRIRH